MNQPFHQTIVEEIKRCPGRHYMVVLLRQIRTTHIPANHDEIAAAIREFYSFGANVRWATDADTTLEALTEKKLATEMAKYELEETTDYLAAVLEEDPTTPGWADRANKGIEHLRRLVSPTG